MSKYKSIVSIGVLTVALVIALGSCSINTKYSAYHHTLLTGWDKSDTLYFNVPPLTSTGRYRQEVGLRINDSYPFTALSLVVEQTVEPSHKYYIDTLRCALTDNKGNTLGQGVSYYQYDFKLKELNLNRGDSLHIAIRHIMKREVTPGIADVGIRLELID